MGTEMKTMQQQREEPTDREGSSEHYGMREDTVSTEKQLGELNGRSFFFFDIVVTAITEN